MKKFFLSNYLISFRGFSSLILIGVITFVFLALGFLFVKGFVFLPQVINNNKQEVVCEIDKDVPLQTTQLNSVEFEPISEVDFQSVPTAIDDKLVLIPLPQYGKAPIPTQIPDKGHGGASYFGDTEPRPAPNLKKTAFIEDGVLGIISADGKKITRLPSELKVEYISGWSPDSKKLMVYVTKQSLEDIFTGYGIQYIKDYNSKKLTGGFYLLNTENGSVDLIEPLETFVNWIGSYQILSLVSFPRNNQAPEEHYVVFDLSNFKGDAQVLENKFVNYFGKQFSFSEDGKKWAFSVGNTSDSLSGSYSNIVLADFPKTEGITVDEGSWAEVQGPIISPDGRRIIYVNHSGGSFWETTIWDGKDKKRLTSGRPYMWVDNNQFLMTHLEYNPATSKTTYKVFLYDISSGKELQLY